MSLIDLIHKNQNAAIATATVATPATHGKKTKTSVAKVASVAVATPEDLKKIRIWLNQIGEPEEDHYLVLNKCRRDLEALDYYLERATEYECKKRQQKVLNMLTDYPDKKRAYATNTETDLDNVILTVAIRGVAAFEMLIPKVKYDPYLLIELINKEALQWRA